VVMSCSRDRMMTSRDLATMNFDQMIAERRLTWTSIPQHLAIVLRSVVPYFRSLIQWFSKIEMFENVRDAH
jgi:hypothetical protein